MDMNSKRKVKLHVVYMVDCNKVRTPVSVCMSEETAQDERIFLSIHFNRIAFVVDECVTDDPLTMMNEAIVNLRSLL